MAVAAQHHPGLRDRERRGLPQRAAALADRAGDPDVASVRRRDGGAAAASIRSGSPRSIDETGATRTSLVPTQLVRWLDHLRAAGSAACRGCEAIYVGGSRIPPAVFERALDVFGPQDRRALRPDRSAGHLLPAAAELAPTPAAQPADGIGRARAARLRGAARRRGRDAADASGEVLIRGGNVMAGYWQDEAATQRCAARRLAAHRRHRRSSTRDGYLRIVGRLKEVIRSGRSTIMPKEVEDVIAAHPAVAEVAVLGLPDIEWGEAVTAFVVLKPGMSATEHDLVEHCRAQARRATRSRARCASCASLPRSHYGKVLRARIDRADNVKDRCPAQRY